MSAGGMAPIGDAADDASVSKPGSSKATSGGEAANDGVKRSLGEMFDRMAPLKPSF